MQFLSNAMGKLSTAVDKVGEGPVQLGQLA